MVAVAADVTLKDTAHHKALDALALILRSYGEDDSEDTVCRFLDLQLPHQAELLDNAELTLEFADNAVQVRHHNEKSDRLVVVVCKEDYIAVDNRLEGLNKVARILLTHRIDTGKECPRLIVDCS